MARRGTKREILQEGRVEPNHTPRPAGISLRPSATARQLLIGTGLAWGRGLFVFLRIPGGGVGRAGGSLLGAPFVPHRLQCFNLRGLGRGEVFRFTDIGGEVVKFGLPAAAAGDNELHVAVPDRPLRAVAPVEGLMWTGVYCAGEKRHQVDAVDLPRRLGFTAGSDDRRGQHVEIHHREVGGFSRGDLAFPLRDERHPRAALERGHFEPAQRAVGGGNALGRSAVVGNEEDERIFFLSELADFSEDAAHGVIHGRHHGGKGLSFFVRDAGETVEILFRGLERGMDGVEREIEKSGLVFILLQPVNRAVGIGVGGVKRVVLHLAHVVREARVDKIGGMKKRRVVERAEEFVEAALRGAVLRLVTEVPLTDRGGGVAEGF